MPPKQTNVDIEKGKTSSGKDEPQWHAMTKEDAAALMGLGKDIRQKGLTTTEAKRRLEEYGPNQLSEKERRTLWQKIWEQLCNVMVAILAVVAIVSLVKGIIAKDAEDRLTNLIEVGLITFVIV
jgi:magnesium-transporting ATPase (P-type)